ncbi:hypothetical protein [Pseudoponticoccus marisrubri]|uniref:Uncharacterized protein n=1 Tax=Pseudoponticoccus marisrubri TaxID=1685382 RepID=A0A0W7WDV7_9RHOB|nr:hypothetical protein [Pseudoponticoccus marisrubri]KUF08663.1 hypothetical protein AVJ23_21555 [Pseudoponticoccus marisrubri]
MSSKLFPSDLQRLFRRDAEGADSDQHPRLAQAGALDLRRSDQSAGRDRSAHRRATWLYEDLLN